VQAIEECLLVKIEELHVDQVLYHSNLVEKEAVDVKFANQTKKRWEL
jgi:hypothetical protein